MSLLNCKTIAKLSSALICASVFYTFSASANITITLYNKYKYPLTVKQGSSYIKPSSITNNHSSDTTVCPELLSATSVPKCTYSVAANTSTTFKEDSGSISVTKITPSSSSNKTSVTCYKKTGSSTLKCDDWDTKMDI